MTTSARLDENQVSNAFHSYLKSSLSQARAERLVDAEMLSSAEADIMITGPALCLYFAALRCTTSPPSVPLPRSGKEGPPVDLTTDNCPRPFIGFLQTWALAVPVIQALTPEHQHDLARIVCGLDPLTSPLHPDLSRIAAELRAVAIEISQRRSFQDRYADDLQAALDTSESGQGQGARAGRRVASFVPPPMYDPSPSPSPSPNSQPVNLPPTSPTQSNFLSPTSPTFPGRSRHQPQPQSQSRSRTPSPSSPPLTPSSANSAFAVDAPAIQLIRETLYASLGDVLARTRHVRRLLRSDPPRAYFAAVALAILDVASSRTRMFPPTSGSGDPEVEVDGVLGAHLTLAACPRPLQPFMRELGSIGSAARAAEEEDTAVALDALASDTGATLPTPRMERVRRMLERGVGAEHRRNLSSEPQTTTDEEGDSDDGDPEQSGRRRSVEGRAIALANRINALALGMTKLRAFRDRQEEVFKILAGVAS